MKIYNNIAKYIENRLNDLTGESPVRFNLQVAYNYIMPEEKPKDPLTVAGTLSFSTSDVMPVQGLDLFVPSAAVTFNCKKSLVNEVLAIVGDFIDEDRGEVLTLGDYVVIPSYTMPERSDLSLIGEIGEGEAVSFYLTYTMIKNGYTANNIKLTIDGAAVYATSFQLAKTRTVPSDNQANSEILQGNAQAQSIVLSAEFIATSDTAITGLIGEIMSEEQLSATHNVSVQMGGSATATTYKTVLSTGSISAQAGGLVYLSTVFAISR